MVENVEKGIIIEDVDESASSVGVSVTKGRMYS